MHLNSALISIFLFVSPALSGPLREKDQFWIPNLVKKSTDGASDHGVDYNYKLAGAYWEETDGAFTFATATFNVPGRAAPSSQDGYAMLVGIDSITCSSWFTAGISSYVTDGKTTYQAWTEWGSNELYYADLAIAPGDVIRASINVFSATSGVAILENVINNRTDVYHFNTTQPLCRRIAMWSAEIPQVGEPIPFDTVTITNAKAYGPSQRIYEAAGARKMEISQKNRAVTSVSTKGSSITINRVHE